MYQLIKISAHYFIVVNLQHQRFCYCLSAFVAFAHRWQHDPALLARLNESVEGVILQRVELHLGSDLRYVDDEGWI